MSGRLRHRPLATFLVCLTLAACGKQPPQAGPAAMPGGPPPVTVAAAIVREVQEVDEFAGRIEATQQVEVRARVKEVVDGMPAIYREVLQLNYFQRMSYQQISEVLGIPLGTVKSRIHAATATFAEQWKAAARRSRGADAGKEFKA